MGKSKHAESLRVLGAPIHAGPPEGAPQIIADNYERAGLFPFPYQRVMIFWNPRTGIVDSVEVQFRGDPPGQLGEAVRLRVGESHLGIQGLWECRWRFDRDLRVIERGVQYMGKSRQRLHLLANPAELALRGEAYPASQAEAMPLTLPALISHSTRDYGRQLHQHGSRSGCTSPSQRAVANGSAMGGRFLAVRPPPCRTFATRLPDTTRSHSTGR